MSSPYKYHFFAVYRGKPGTVRLKGSVIRRSGSLSEIPFQQPVWVLKISCMGAVFGSVNMIDISRKIVKIAGCNEGLTGTISTEANRPAAD